LSFPSFLSLFLLPFSFFSLLIPYLLHPSLLRGDDRWGEGRIREREMKGRE
jgi:hypothetical protein